jgi:hypothetical protein
MSIIKPEYLELPPHGRSLDDVVVLAQAWKKAHTFIRRHNWYADVLELDSSTIDLERRLQVWASEVREPDFAPEPLRLVPAPKNAKWEFRRSPLLPILPDEIQDVDLSDIGPEPSFADWTATLARTESASNIKASTQKLRPLAHLTIRDQTLATSVMMCLAEAIESAQGDTSEKDYLKARSDGIVSYGNRLQCRWIDTGVARQRAHFSWGNHRTYRQYFQDYRAFLARPRRVCAELSAQTQSGRELFVVSLDLKAFFDRVDTAALLRELQLLEAEYRKDFGLPDRLAPDNEFWRRAARIFNWEWRIDEHAHAGLVTGSDKNHLELGLPQGLVASGFFANAYLIRLDRRANEAARQALELPDGIKILDYCRYVDDVRIVVEGQGRTGGPQQDEILRRVKEYFQQELEAHRKDLLAAPPLELSEEKCGITPYRSISAQSNLSALMDVLQAELSGTFDLESLVQAAGGLDGLLWMSEQIDADQEPRSSRLMLASVAVPNPDVRDDTVKRFVATRLAQMLRHRLAMTDVAASVEARVALSEQVTNGMALAHEFESTARKLIKCWAENPSLALLLRCGLDLYPHPKLLSPVTEALGTKLFGLPPQLSEDQLREVRVAEYVIADLFRAGATETGFRDDGEYPESVDVEGYRENLAALARRVLTERPESPWYVHQQAHLFLAAVGDLSLAAKDEVAIPEVAAYRSLQRAMLFQAMHSQDLVNVLPLALVAQQLTANGRRFGIWLSEGLRMTHDEGQQETIVLTVALNRPDLMMEAMVSRGGRAPRWKRFVPRSLVASSRRSAGRRLNAFGRADRPLSQIMAGTNNPFEQENALLMLAQALLRVDGIEARLSGGLSASDITLECSDWSRIQALQTDPAFLRVLPIQQDEETPNPLYETPPWVAENKAWLYGLGRILRAALTGEFDFTSRRFLVTEDVGRYSGMRSTWFKRRFGLLNSGRGLLDEPGPVSPWLSSLLSTLLQWPGVEFQSNDAEAAAASSTPGELLALLGRRVIEQRMLYGVRSGTPMYVIPTADHAELEDRPLRVAIVQPLRPRREEFDNKDPTHWTAGVLAQHRGHLAELRRSHPPWREMNATRLLSMWCCFPSWRFTLSTSSCCDDSRTNCDATSLLG